MWICLFRYKSVSSAAWKRSNNSIHIVVKSLCLLFDFCKISSHLRDYHLFSHFDQIYQYPSQPMSCSVIVSALLHSVAANKKHQIQRSVQSDNFWHILVMVQTCPPCLVERRFWKQFLTVIWRTDRYCDLPTIRVIEKMTSSSCTKGFDIKAHDLTEACYPLLLSWWCCRLW